MKAFRLLIVMTAFAPLVSCAPAARPATAPDASAPATAPAGVALAAESVVRVTLTRRTPGGVIQRNATGVVLRDLRILTAWHALFDDTGELADGELIITRPATGGAAPGDGNLLVAGTWSFTTLEGSDVVLIDAPLHASAPVGVELAPAPAQLGQPVMGFGLGIGAGGGVAPSRLVERRNRVAGISDDGRFFALDGPSASGDSGGPVFDERGRLLGLYVAESRRPLPPAFGVSFVPLDPRRHRLSWDPAREAEARGAGPMAIVSSVRSVPAGATGMQPPDKATDRRVEPGGRRD